MDRRTHGWGSWRDGWIDGSIDGCGNDRGTDGQRDEWTDVTKHILLLIPSLQLWKK